MILYLHINFYFNLYLSLVIFIIVTDEEEYWWFELMILLNKTMMCGGLVVLAPGSPLQVLAAILIMMLHLLFVLKLAPYIKDSEDWSAFLSTLGLCLLSLGAYSMMLQLEENEMVFVDIITTVLPLLCILFVFGIMLFQDCGLWKYMMRKKVRQVRKKNNRSQVQPVNDDGDKDGLASVKNWN